MANWQRTLNIKDVWESNDIPLVAKTAANRLAALAPFNDKVLDWEKQELIDELLDLADDPRATKDDFNCVWSQVYDWADTKLDDLWPPKKVCWIKIF